MTSGCIIEVLDPMFFVFDGRLDIEPERQVEQILRLADWVRQRRSGASWWDVKVVHLIEPELPDVLADADLYPLSDSIGRWLKENELEDVYDVTTLEDVVNYVLFRSLRLNQSIFGEWTVDAPTLVEPGWAQVPKFQHLSDYRNGLFLRMCLAASTDAFLASRLQICSPLATESGPARWLCHADAIMSAEGDIVDDVEVAQELGVTNLVSPEMFPALDSLSIWRSGRFGGTEALMCSVKVSLAQRSVAESPWTDVRFCSEFIASAERHQAFSAFAETTHELIVQILSGGYRLTRRFRDKLLDDFAGYREHINEGNPALRLMLWATADGAIMFANVGPKKELYISNKCFE